VLLNPCRDPSENVVGHRIVGRRVERVMQAARDNLKNHFECGEDVNVNRRARGEIDRARARNSSRPSVRMMAERDRALAQLVRARAGALRDVLQKKVERTESRPVHVPGHLFRKQLETDQVARRRVARARERLGPFMARDVRRQ
jgi:hypothetical protein